MNPETPHKCFSAKQAGRYCQEPKQEFEDNNFNKDDIYQIERARKVNTGVRELTIIQPLYKYDGRRTTLQKGLGGSNAFAALSVLSLSSAVTVLFLAEALS